MIPLPPDAVAVSPTHRAVEASTWREVRDDMRRAAELIDSRSVPKPTLATVIVVSGGRATIYVNGACVGTVDTRTPVDLTPASQSFPHPFDAVTVADVVRLIEQHRPRADRFMGAVRVLANVVEKEKRRAWFASLAPCPDRWLRPPTPHRRRSAFLRWRVRAARSP